MVAFRRGVDAEQLLKHYFQRALNGAGIDVPVTLLAGAHELLTFTGGPVTLRATTAALDLLCRDGEDALIRFDLRGGISSLMPYMSLRKDTILVLDCVGGDLFLKLSASRVRTD